MVNGMLITPFSWDHNLTSHTTYIVARAKRTQTRNGENEVVYTAGNQHHDIWHHIRLDPKLTFWIQIRHAVAKLTSLLSGLMANIDDPTQSKRRLVMAIMYSILIYGSEFWANALKINCRIKILSSVQRTVALRLVSAYRTVFKSAIVQWHNSHRSIGKRTEESVRG